MKLISANLVIASGLFLLGLVGVLVRRNIIFILMSIEIMLNATGLAFIGAGARWAQADGQVFLFFILCMAAAEVAVGLALVLQLHHRLENLDIDAANSLSDQNAVRVPHVAPVPRPQGEQDVA